MFQARVNPRPVLLILAFFASLFSAVPATASGPEQDEPVRRLIRWSRLYRAGKNDDLAVESYYRQYAHARSSFLAAPGRGKTGRPRAGMAAVVHELRRYDLGRIDGVELARFIRGKRGSRRIGNLAPLAEMLAVFDAAAGIEAAPAVQARAADAFLELATHAFGGSLEAEADRWGVNRRHHPMLVRREARRHLARLAARSGAARERLLDVARGRAAIATRGLDAGEVALGCLAAVDVSRLSDADAYVLARGLMDALTRRGSFWTQLAAAHRLARLRADYLGHLLVRGLTVLTSRLAVGEGSPGAMVSRQVVAASGAWLARVRKTGGLKAPWSEVRSAVRVLVDGLLALVTDRRLPLPLRFDALTALEKARHWHVVHGLAGALESATDRAIKAEIYARLLGLTRFPGKGPDEWRFWYEHHRAERDGPLEAPRYAPEPEPDRFYGVPVVGERILFIIDTSGSMADPLALEPTSQADKDSKIGRTRTELIRVIQGLDDRRRFNALFFDESVTWLFDDMTRATRKNRREAVARIESQSGSGWTDLARAVLAAFGRKRLGRARPLPASESRARRTSAEPRSLPDQIILLSDGMPTKGDLFIPGDFVDEIDRLNRGLGIRIDTVALGPESDPFFLSEIAQRNRGTMTIFPEELRETYERFREKM